MKLGFKGIKAAGFDPGLIWAADRLNCVPGGLTRLEVDGSGDITESRREYKTSAG